MVEFQWYDPDSVNFDLSDERFILRDDWDLGGIASIEEIIVSPYQDGGTSVDSRLKPATVRVNYSIICTSPGEAEALMKEIKAAFNPTAGIGVLYYTDDNGETLALYCRVSDGFPYFPPGYPNRFLVGDPSIIILNLEFTAADPFWYGEGKSEAFWALIPELFPFEFDWELGSASPSHEITNGGNVTTPVLITIHGQNTDCIITNTTTGESITLNLVMAVGDLFEIDTTPGMQTAVYTPSGGPAETGWPSIDASSTFFQLIKGPNTITFTFANEDADTYAVVQWADRFVGA